MPAISFRLACKYAHSGIMGKPEVGSRLVITGQITFPELQRLEMRFGDLFSTQGRGLVKKSARFFYQLIAHLSLPLKRHYCGSKTFLTIKQKQLSVSKTLLKTHLLVADEKGI